MSSNVCPNPGPIFPCSVCAGNVAWRGKSVQCCTCSKLVQLRYSPNSELLAALILGAVSLLVTAICILPLYNLAPSANAALPPQHRLQTFYPPSAHFLSSPSAPSPPSLAPGCPSTPPVPSLPGLPQGSSMECWRSLQGRIKRSRGP